MRRITLFLLLVAQLAVVVSLLSCMRAAPPPHPTPLPPGEPVAIWFSLENSAAESSTLDAFATTLVTLAAMLDDLHVDYRVSLFRSTENADGNYDARAQGATPIVSSADTDPVSELRANLAALRAAHQGTKPLPLEILNRAAAFPGAVVDKGRRRLLIAIASTDATNQIYLLNGATVGGNYAVAWDWYFGVGNWSTVAMVAPSDINRYTNARMVSEQYNHLLPNRVFTVGGDISDLAGALASWR